MKPLYCCAWQGCLLFAPLNDNRSCFDFIRSSLYFNILLHVPSRKTNKEPCAEDETEREKRRTAKQEFLLQTKLLRTEESVGRQGHFDFQIILGNNQVLLPDGFVPWKTESEL